MKHGLGPWYEWDVRRETRPDNVAPAWLIVGRYPGCAWEDRARVIGPFSEAEHLLNALRGERV